MEAEDGLEEVMTAQPRHASPLEVQGYRADRNVPATSVDICGQRIRPVASGGIDDTIIGFARVCRIVTRNPGLAEPIEARRFSDARPDRFMVPYLFVGLPVTFAALFAFENLFASFCIPWVVASCICSESSMHMLPVFPGPSGIGSIDLR
jgi:hypothetical protein